MAASWGARLSTFLYWRNHVSLVGMGVGGNTEDYRYQVRDPGSGAGGGSATRFDGGGGGGGGSGVARWSLARRRRARPASVLTAIPTKPPSVLTAIRTNHHPH
jgi:hypothetical protein